RHTASNNYQVNVETPSYYENRVSCIRKQIPWRPGRGYNSIEPKIYGLQTALVVGPKGEEIHTDKYGRVRVQFHWDRIGEYDEKSSAWIRVATSWSGANFGVTAIPRIGSEVIVQFMDGNPDRPLVTGMVPNEDTMVPWTLPENKTQSGVLTRSTPKGNYNTANALRFEDKKGQEQLWLHAEKDQLTEVEHDEDKWVGNDRRKTIDRDETTLVKRDRTETVDRDETITIHNNRKERVDHDETISIGDNRTEDVGINETITIGANRTKTVVQNETDSIGGAWTIDVAMMKTETIGLASVQNVGMARMDNVGLGYDLNVGMSMATIVGKSQITQVENSIAIVAGDELSITVGKAKLLMKSDGTIIFNGHTFSVGTSDEQVFKADGNITLNGKKILEN
ncbi:type VI secretion system Vgr family protein, partial [Massilia genomosp. 1]